METNYDYLMNCIRQEIMGFLWVFGMYRSEDAWDVHGSNLLTWLPPWHHGHQRCEAMLCSTASDWSNIEAQRLMPSFVQAVGTPETKNGDWESNVFPDVHGCWESIGSQCLDLGCVTNNGDSHGNITLDRQRRNCNSTDVYVLSKCPWSPFDPGQLVRTPWWFSGGSPWIFTRVSGQIGTTEPCDRSLEWSSVKGIMPKIAKNNELLWIIIICYSG